MRYLVFLTPPRIRFAHKYSTNHYDFEFARTSGFLEIAVHTKGGFICESAREKKVFSENSVHCMFRTEDVHCYSNEPQEHYTVGIEAQFALSDEPSEYGIPVEECVTEKNTVERFLEKVKGIIRLKQSAPNHCRESAAVYDLLSLYVDYGKLQELHENDFSAAYTFLRYGTRAQEYIAAHMTEKITISEIADYLGVSCSYLSKLFKQYTGETIVHYINRKRLEVLLGIVRSKHCSLAEACTQLNLIDPNYVSFMFKKYYGKNFSALLAEI